MNIYIYLIWVLFYLIEYSKTSKIKLVYYPNNSNEKYIKNLIDEFNKYSVENGLEIDLESIFYKEITTPEQYSETIDYNLSMKSIKYDMIVIDMIDTHKFTKHFEILDPEIFHINKYDNDLLKNICTFNGKSYTLPLYIEYSMLYTNNDIYDKYEKTIPSTWEELAVTAKEIVMAELNNGNEIIGYTSDMSDTEEGFVSFYEYIYSFRNDVNDPFPDIKNQEVIEAMEKLKGLKKEY
eukprot:jgi/Orpsp1_1/1177419/evm.model.c7180000061388.1